MPLQLLFEKDYHKHTLQKKKEKLDKSFLDPLSLPADQFSFLSMGELQWDQQTLAPRMCLSALHFPTALPSSCQGPQNQHLKKSLYF